ncbi:MAG TPA: GNAT family N-acetyltransferase [Thermoanaerobaculia bacterium]|jgi:GNAT superfamily N-acetyltransferase|nr:GNAT family N-acetyltransferase [Thermoanaerobaculia bacterium]
MELRIATSDDATWINERYESVGFVLSDLARHFVIIAELDGIPAGLGRLVPASDTAYELGGMLVFEEYRGRGIARAIIEQLLRHAGDRAVYCIPFAELEPIYAGVGFVRREAEEDVPKGIREKLDWCARELPERPVILMMLER